MKKEFNLLKKFHICFGIFRQDIPNMNIPQNIIEGRISMMTEELKEVVDAMNDNNDIVHLAKELGDLLYLTLGTIDTYGLSDKFPDIFKAVHESNMSKLDYNNKPIKREDGKILKSANYKNAEPAINKILFH
ncbi:MAG: nucleoside triphosphate pyrophosphohydrolase family protein [bacterium]